MPLEQLLETLPEFAKDLKLNMGGVMRQTELTEEQTWGTAVCCGMAARNAELLEAILEEAPKHLGEQAMFAAQGAGAIMGMNNIYYRFRHLSSNPKYPTMPARLRMQIIARHGGDPVNFELWCLAASSINGCAACVDSHEKVLLEKGVSEETILAAVRIAAVIHAVAAVLG